MSEQLEAQSLFALESLNQELVANAQIKAIEVVAKALAKGEITRHSVEMLQKTVDEQIND